MIIKCPVCDTRYCSEHFDRWWNRKTFDWNNSSFLAQCCPNHFDEWWDEDKYN